VCVLVFMFPDERTKQPARNASLMCLYINYLLLTYSAAAYNEKYLRNEDDIDMKLKDKYYGSMQEAKDKTPLLTQKIRGKDLDLDGAMNKLVWGGKAKLPKVKEAENNNNDHDKEDTIVAKNEQPKKAKKKRKKKKKGAAAEERERESKKLMLQSLAAGVTLGAAAVAATVLVGSSRPK
jgi:hypothetical protein